LHSYYADPEIEIAPPFGEQWMSYPFLFDSRAILPEWAMAMAAGADLTARIEAKNERTLATLRAPLGNPSSFLSYDLLRDAGIDIATAAPYQALIGKMNSDLNSLEQDTGAIGPSRQ
jgi:oligoendopeptidase F